MQAVNPAVSNADAELSLRISHRSQPLSSVAVATWAPFAGTAQSQRDGSGDVLSPAHKVNDESDDE